MLISLGVPEVKLKTGWEIQVIKVKNLQSLSDAVVQCRSQPRMMPPLLLHPTW